IADTSVTYSPTGRGDLPSGLPGGSIQSTAGVMTLTQRGVAKSGARGKRSASARTALLSRSDGTRLGGGGVPAVTHWNIASIRARIAGATVCGLPWLASGPRSAAAGL